MFQRLYEFSQCLPERPAWQRLNEGMQAPYDRGLALCFDPKGEWAGVATVYKTNDEPVVVFRSGSSRDINFTPCYKLSPDTSNRMCRSIEKLITYSEMPTDKRLWLEHSLLAFKNRQSECWIEIETASRQAGVDGKEHRGYVYWCCKDGMKLEPVYDWPEAKRFMAQRFLDTFNKGGTRGGVCAVCGQDCEIVYGNFSVLACYNLDKPGSIAGGFRPERAHRNLPVCENCALALAEAFNFANVRFRSSMGGQPYLILPYANDPTVRADLKYSLEMRPDRFTFNKIHDLISDETALVDEFAKRGDQLAFALIFFDKDQASWRIQTEVQHLLPSRIKVLYDARKQIEKANDLTIEQQDGLKPLCISTQTFRNFARATGTGKTSADTLRTWLVALFDHQRVNIGYFLSCLVSGLIATGKTHPEYLRDQTRQAWGLYRYALLTGLIQTAATEDYRMAEVIPDSPHGRYLAAHRDFFCKPELAVAFLTGCYAATVASIQRKEYGNDPFTKKFMGRLLNQNLLRRLYREGHGKLAQYGKLGYVIQTLDPDLANAWIGCGDRWTINDEETTFAFTIGYSLSYRIQQLDSDKAVPEE